MEYIDSTHDEWDNIWQQLANDPMNRGDQLCIHKGRTWEYMGSNMDHHHFRHESHPLTRKTEYIYIERIGFVTANCA